eukprot:4671549-Ditylum_brightwellii.AAC.1
MEHRMDLWEKGDYTALVEDTIKVNKHQQPTGQRNESAEHIYTNTGLIVKEVLLSKHPDPTPSPESAFDSRDRATQSEQNAGLSWTGRL